MEAGFKVQIHIQGEPPFIHELGFGVAPGFQTLVATQEQRVRTVDRTDRTLMQKDFLDYISAVTMGKLH